MPDSPGGTLVTVIVPAYNHARYIEDCLESVVASTHRPIELLVLDDGSTDGTAEAAERWVQHLDQSADLRARAWRHENRGVTSTLNELIDAATGWFIAPVASDDYLLPDGIAIRLQHAEAHGCQAVFGDCIVVDDSGRKTAQSGLADLHHGDAGALSSDLLAELITNWAVPGPVLMVGRDFALSLGGYDELLGQDDWDFFLRMAIGGSLCFIDQPVAAYRRHASNLSFDPTFRDRQLGDTVVTLRRAILGTTGRHRLLAQVQLFAAVVEAKGRGGAVPTAFAARALRAGSRVLARSTRAR